MILNHWLKKKSASENAEQDEQPPVDQGGVLYLSPEEIAALSKFRKRGESGAFATHCLGVDVKNRRVAATDARRILVLENVSDHEPKANEYRVPVQGFDKQKYGKKFPNYSNMIDTPSGTLAPKLSIDLDFLKDLVEAFSLIGIECLDGRMSIRVIPPGDSHDFFRFEIPTQNGTAIALIMPRIND